MKIRFKDYNCQLTFAKYGNGRIAIRLVDAEDGEVITDASVNLPDEPLGKDEVFIKNYSENEGMLETLIAAKIVQPTGRMVKSGYVTIPVCKLLVDTNEDDDEY